LAFFFYAQNSPFSYWLTAFALPSIPSLF